MVYFEDGTFNIKYWNGTSFDVIIQPLFWSNVKPIKKLKPFYKPTFVDYIKEELKERRMSLIDFAVSSGLDSMLIINLLQNKLVINNFIIKGLIKSFGFTEKYWKH